VGKSEGRELKSPNFICASNRSVSSEEPRRKPSDGLMTRGDPFQTLIPIRFEYRKGEGGGSANRSGPDYIPLEHAKDSGLATEIS